MANKFLSSLYLISFDKRCFCQKHKDNRGFRLLCTLLGVLRSRPSYTSLNLVPRAIPFQRVKSWERGCTSLLWVSSKRELPPPPFPPRVIDSRYFRQPGVWFLRVSNPPGIWQQRKTSTVSLHIWLLIPMVSFLDATRMKRYRVLTMIVFAW